MAETWIPRASSHIGQVTYDSEAQTLDVTFASGDEYRYSGVPVGVFQSWQNAQSAGQFFLRQVKDRYGYEQI